MVTQN